ncbi:eRF1 domain 3 family protein [Trichomonas vaginalis G3]|uniref:ERF1 domain 3 family protein n=1 Tax=Trichomonas vaginalis (strain ATCC PRA-98 / G3) TaxID=412133 RepID=A2ERW1_TRIV3|nr:nuclear-transcribed mRNA catabolic process, no-go decay [Trichomonas vaginalis G3]EAY04628.1 eRF1 domain 3 family protein [Trichomonas vaginalis G3]KAI5539609.1 nuclear-transcribed mRNA catabolic process, no-go decay [Trichomonas vaginalis G3]|eukprot:XP_001316851.1 eRF1 domain 3 family protein [Trichomonas vaginalis G3]
MKLDLSKVPSSRVAVIMTDENDDFKALSEVIKDGDIITTQIRRKIEIGSTKKIEIHVARVEITGVEFELGSNEMWLSGRIADNYEFAKVGASQRVLLRLGSKFELWKHEWTSEEIEKLKCSQDNSSGVETLVILLGKHSVSIYNQLGKHIATSHYTNEGKLYEETQKLLEDLDKSDLKCILLISSSSPTDKLYSYLCDNSLALNIAAVAKDKAILQGTCKADTTEGVLEAIAKQQHIIDNYIYSMYINEYQKFNQSMLMDIDKVALGNDNVKKATQYGAIDTLFVTEDYIRKIEDSKRAAFNKFIEYLKSTGSNVLILPKRLAQNSELNNLSGIAATLRFKI